MKKALVTISIGAEHQMISVASAPFREHYAKRHGWIPVDFDKLPEEIVHDHPTLSVGRQCLLFKLYVCKLLLEYDLVLFVDTDAFLSPTAPCISSFAQDIPKGGFAGAQTQFPSERESLFGWDTKNYYEGLEKKHGIKLDEVPYPDVAVNSGLVLFKPQEVHDNWMRLYKMDSPLTQENRLNVFETQSGRCKLLPNEWHTVWFYEKYRIGFLKPQRNKAAEIYNILKNRFYSQRFPESEYRALAKAFGRTHFMHLAFEDHKVLAYADKMRQQFLAA